MSSPEIGLLAHKHPFANAYVRGEGRFANVYARGGSLLSIIFRKATFYCS